MGVGLAVLGGLIGGSDASAYVVKRTSTGDLVHWEHDEVAYTLDASVASNVALKT